MLSIDYFAEFQVEGPYEGVEESGGGSTAGPPSGPPDEGESNEEKRSKSQKRGHGGFQASDSLRLCTHELERAAKIRHNGEVDQQPVDQQPVHQQPVEEPDGNGVIDLSIDGSADEAMRYLTQCHHKG